MPSPVCVIWPVPATMPSAPPADPDGNRAQVRFARKSKEQYVMTEVDGKATGWKAFYRDGKWQQEQSAARAKGKAKSTGGRNRK